MQFMSVKIKILSYAESDFKSVEDELNTEEMVFYTVQKALKAAALEIGDIGTVINCGDDILEGIAISHTFLIEPSGAFLKEESKVEEDGAFGLFYAVNKVLAEFDTAMVVAYSKSSNSGIAELEGEARNEGAQKKESGSWYYRTQLDPFYLRPLGIDMLNYHAMQYSAFLNHNSDLSSREVSEVLLKNKSHGLSNSNAPFSGEYTFEEIYNSPYVAEPVKQVEVPLQTDGCSVLIIGRESYTKVANKKCPCIVGMGLASDSYYPGYRKLHQCETAGIALERALKMAERKIEEVQIAELYELFPYQELMLYQNLFGWDNAKIKKSLSEGLTKEGGALPVNLSGGCSSAHPIFAAGLSRIIHLCENMSRKGLKLGLAHSQSGLGMQSNIVYLIES